MNTIKPSMLITLLFSSLLSWAEAPQDILKHVLTLPAYSTESNRLALAQKQITEQELLTQAFKQYDRAYLAKFIEKKAEALKASKNKLDARIPHQDILNQISKIETLLAENIDSENDPLRIIHISNLFDASKTLNRLLAAHARQVNELKLNALLFPEAP